MSGISRPHVVVGVDGSKCDQLAIRWATKEASMRRLPLRVVHVLDPPVMARPYDLELADRILAYCAEHAKQVMDDAAARARSLAPDVEVTPTVVTGQVVPALLAETDDARLVVLGSGWRFDAGRVRLGSVAAHVSAHARCPVIVARAPEKGELASAVRRGGIVVGVDGSAISEAAVAFAYEEASWRGLGLTVLHAWQMARMPVTFDVPQATRQAAEERVLAEALAGWSEKYPDVRVMSKLVLDHPARALMEEAMSAALLVVGSHGRGRFAEMLLGSVSQVVLRHASTSIAIVRNHESRNR
jgi:nucleotide-binding universal stress UspA family protein